MLTQGVNSSPPTLLVISFPVFIIHHFSYFAKLKSPRVGKKKRGQGNRNYFQKWNVRKLLGRIEKKSWFKANRKYEWANRRYQMHTERMWFNRTGADVDFTDRGWETHQKEPGRKKQDSHPVLFYHPCNCGQVRLPMKREGCSARCLLSVSLMQEFVRLRLQLICSPVQCLRTKQFRCNHKEQYATEISLEWGLGESSVSMRLYGQAWGTVFSIIHSLIISGLVGRDRMIPGTCWPDVVTELRAVSSL